MIYPDLSRAIVVLTNTNVTPTYLKIADELSYLLFEPTADDKFARSVFAGLQSGRIDQSMLSEDLKQYLTKTRLQEYSSSLTPLGSVEAFALSNTHTTDGLTTREYDLIVGGKRLRLRLLLLLLLLPNIKVEDVTISSAE